MLGPDSLDESSLFGDSPEFLTEPSLNVGSSRTGSLAVKLPDRDFPQTIEDCCDRHDRDPL